MLSSLAPGAGCSEAETHSCAAEWTVSSPQEVMDEYRDLVRGFPGYRALTQTELDRLNAAFGAAVARHAGRDGVARIPTKACIGIGTKAPGEIQSM
jgi:hypothetical protein